MEIDQIKVGEYQAILVNLIEPISFNYEIEAVQDVRIFMTGQPGEYTITIGQKTCFVAGAGIQEEVYLTELFENNQPFICYIASNPLKKNNREQLLLEFRRFFAEGFMPIGECERIFIADEIFDLIRRNYPSLRQKTNGFVLNFLYNKCVFHLRGKACFTIAAGVMDGPSLDITAFRIIGDGIALDIFKKGGRYLATKIVKYQPKNNSEPITLLRGELHFEDISVAEQFAKSGATELDALVSQSESYLSLWNEYNNLEKKKIVEKAREFGWLYYDRIIPLHQIFNGWRLYIEKKSKGNTKSLESILDSFNEDIQLEIARVLPTELAEEDSFTDSTTSFYEENQGIPYECLDTNSEGLWIDVVPLSEDDTRQPPDKGCIYATLSGDRVRLQRRKNAWDRIRLGRTGIPYLGFLLEKSQKYIPKSITPQKVDKGKTRKAFSGEPTPKQEQAIRIALNTPDIAVIQGPPGTGKTRVIGAINRLITEMEPDDGKSLRPILITSYQHTAVETAAAKTFTFGLPAIKFGRKHRNDVIDEPVERWANELLVKLLTDPQYDKTRLPASYQKICNKFFSYFNSPGTTGETLTMLRDIHHEYAPILDDATLERLNILIDKLEKVRSTEVYNDIENRTIKKFVNALGVGKESFLDNGPDNANALKNKLVEIGYENSADIELLHKASNWTEDSLPPFLADLSDLKLFLLKRYSIGNVSSTKNLPNMDVEEILHSVLKTVHGKYSIDSNDPISIITKYQDELTNDIEGVRQTLMHYTKAFAATCQQSNKPSLYSITNPGNFIEADVMFNSIIIDEAARANPLDLFIPMSLANRRIVLVGDHRQLPHILEPDVEREMGLSSEATKEALGKSLFERLFDQYLDDLEKKDGIPRRVTLDQQFRMHPKLGAFVSRAFYEKNNPAEKFYSDFVTPGEFQLDLEGLNGKIAGWVDIPISIEQENGSHSKYRLSEARWIAKEVSKYLGQATDKSVGIISFYKRQVNEILRALIEFDLAEENDNTPTIAKRINAKAERLRVGTVDAFQGKEFDIVILSMTRSNNLDPKPDDEKMQRRKYGFLTLENRLCVAMSRQKCLLMVVGDLGMIQHRSAKSAVPGLVQFYEDLCRSRDGFTKKIRSN